MGRRSKMMAVQVGGVTYELEGVLYRRMPSCSLRKAGGKAITQTELDGLSDDDRDELLGLIRRHIEAVAFLSGARTP
jgi:hypothetical protein